ncbi:BnaC07g12570D [Brassica napus]|uniref:BnaC07g12570D protein n=1 Tax=Brassica napus TaxID=3708 RepID=A0A078GTB0_BRANA|nr:BnaC07g12570D [Brassica napus]
MENLRRNNSTIGSPKPTTTNFTTSLRARCSIMGDGGHASAIDVSGLWHRL